MKIPKPSTTPAKPAPVRQFSLRELFFWTFLAALICAPTAWLGVPGLVVSALVALPILWRHGRLTIVELLVVVALMGVLVSLLLPAVQTTGRRPPHTIVSLNNLKMIALALRNYEQQKGTLPPAFIADENGQPMHSWRVLILPFLGRPDIYELYRFDEPWNGPNNRLLHDQIVDVYSCPSNPRSTNTSYFAVVGDPTAWPGSEGRMMSDITDAQDATILVIESKDIGVHWMEPRDLDWTSLSTSLNRGSLGQSLPTKHKGGGNVAMADGSVHFLPAATSGTTIKAMLTIAGGETVDSDDW